MRRFVAKDEAVEHVINCTLVFNPASIFGKFVGSASLCAFQASFGACFDLQEHNDARTSCELFQKVFERLPPDLPS